MYADRLLMLADYLQGVGQFEGRGVPKNKFDMNHWMATYHMFDNKFEGLKTDKKKPIFQQNKSGSI